MSPIPQMEVLDHRIHAGVGRHFTGARALHFMSLSLCVIVIGGFNSFFQGQGWGAPFLGRMLSVERSSARRVGVPVDRDQGRRRG
jgi:hypothetical protein